MRIALRALTQIREQLVAHEQALRVMYVELHQPGACDKWAAAMAARVDFDHLILQPATTVDIPLEVTV